MKEDDELSMDKIEDYNDNESSSKRKTVRLVIIGCLLVGAVLVFLKLNNNQVNDYVGTEQNPGINTNKR